MVGVPLTPGIPDVLIYPRIGFDTLHVLKKRLLIESERFCDLQDFIRTQFAMVFKQDVVKLPELVPFVGRDGGGRGHSGVSVAANGVMLENDFDFLWIFFEHLLE